MSLDKIEGGWIFCDIPPISSVASKEEMGINLRDLCIQDGNHSIIRSIGYICDHYHSHKRLHRIWELKYKFDIRVHKYILIQKKTKFLKYTHLDLN